MIKKGYIIKNKKTGNKHIVESVDYYDNITLVFTEDSKYIPLDDIEFCSKSKLSDFFLSIFYNESSVISKEEIVNFFGKKKLIEVNTDIDSMKKEIDEYIKNL